MVAFIAPLAEAINHLHPDVNKYMYNKDEYIS